jgi:hypothetical protein
MIPTSSVFDQSVMTAMLDHDPVVAQYRAFFSFLDWSLVEHFEAQRTGPGRPAHPESAYLKAFLIRQNEGFIYTSQLRRFLLRHPLLVIDLGFHLVLDPNATYGFDIDKTLPCRYWLTEKLQRLDQDLLQALLQATVVALQQEIPGLGEVMAFDVKHIYAWVKENNPRVYVKDRYAKDQVLVGDPDCKLGVKRSSNRSIPDASDQPQSSSAEPSVPSTAATQQDSPSSASSGTPSSDPKEKQGKQEKKGKKEEKEYLWGYGSGVAAATDPVYGEVVFAEHTLTFNEADLTSFRPLLRRGVLACGHYPTYLAADAAFDCWSIHTCCAPGGFAAVPLRKVTKTIFDPDGVPLCVRGLRMHPATNSSIPMATAPSAIGVHSSFPCAPARPVSMSNLAKRKAVSRTSISSSVAFGVSCLIATAPSTTRSTTSGPRASASTVCLKLWASNDPKCATSVRYAISIP